MASVLAWIMPATAQNIERIEYYLDTDPGLGQAISVQVIPGTSADVSFNADISYLSDGFHSLYVRAKNQNGQWSLNATKHFFKTTTPALSDSSNKISRLEYYLDTDPGYGNATPVPISVDISFSTEFTVDLSGVSAGFHTLYIRAKDQNNQWSLVSARLFSKGALATDALPDITQLEYFLTNGQDTSQVMILDDFAPAPNITHNITVDLSSIAIDRPWNLHLKALDDRGSQSLYHVQNFNISTDIVGPTIVLTALDSMRHDRDAVISAQIQDNESGIREVQLFYRSGGSTVFQDSLNMSRSNDDTALYRATIPGSSVTYRGLDFYIQAIDSIGNVSQFPQAGDSPLFTSLQVFATGLSRPDNLPSFPAAKNQNDYRMISIPYILEDSDPLTVLLDDLDPNVQAYRPSEWQVFRWINGENQEYPNVGNFAPGRAFWLVVKNGGQMVNIGNARSVSTESDYTIALQPGWNQIANPFSFPVSKSAVWAATGSGVSQLDDKIWGYQGSYFEAAIFEPWDGYWIFNQSSNIVHLRVPPVEGTPKVNSKQLAINSENSSVYEWSVRITAISGELHDSNNHLGVSHLAQSKRDALDYVDPPFLKGGIAVYFPHDDWGTSTGSYGGDFRPESDDGWVWDFATRSDSNVDQISLQFEGIHTIPENSDVYIFDLENHVEQDLRLQPEYTYISNSNKREHSFKLVVGRESYMNEVKTSFIPDSYALHPNSPNPFNPETTIRFDLPRSSWVQLKVYNTIGQEVRTLADRMFPPGYHAVKWDGRNNQGGRAVSGMFLYQLTTPGFSLSQKMILLK